jgi:hypothetical protein
MSITLYQNYTAISNGLTASFSATGGTAPYTYAIVNSINSAGGAINSLTGVYTAPAAYNSDPKYCFDTIKVIDANLEETTSQILIGNHLILFCDILRKGMRLSNGRVYLWDQKIFSPTDNDLFIAVSVLNSKPFGNTISYDYVTNNTVQSINMLDILSIDIISRGPAARDRKFEILMAINNQYSEQQQEYNSFRIGLLPAGSQFVNLSEVDGAAIPYRFRINLNIQYVSKIISQFDYYDDFLPVEIVSNA